MIGEDASVVFVNVARPLLVNVEFVVTGPFKLLVEATLRTVPTNRDFAIPTPPANVALPVMEEMASVFDANVIVELNVAGPSTPRKLPINTDLAIPTPPLTTKEPVVVFVASVVDVEKSRPLANV